MQIPSNGRVFDQIRNGFFLFLFWVGQIRNRVHQIYIEEKINKNENEEEEENEVLF